MKKEIVKLVVYVPETHADKVREAMGKTGAGVIGKYKHCSFSVKGVGRYIPTLSAKPYIGKVGKLEEIIEEKIETVCYKKDIKKIINSIKKVHPYEEVPIDIYPLLTNLMK